MSRRLLTVLRRAVTGAYTPRYVAAMLLWKTGLSRFFTIRRTHYELTFYPSVFSAVLWADPAARHREEELLTRLLPPGGTCVDVGANIGTLTLAAAHAVGPTGRVFAFEPHPRTFRFLRGNVERNRARQVTLFNCAVGESSGTLGFTDRPNDDQNTVTPDGTVAVPVKRLDDCIPAEVRSIDVLKIDVEGFEKFVLAGAPRVLASTRVVQFEAWDAHFERFGYRAGDVIRLLEAHGFACYAAEDTACPRVGPEFVASSCTNLYAARTPEMLSTAAAVPDDLPERGRR